jgi:hypothetical protein
MSGEGSTQGSRYSQDDAEREPPGECGEVRPPGPPRRGIPALLDWIEEAEAVNRGVAARLQVVVLVVVFILLLLVRLGCAP